MAKRTVNHRSMLAIAVLSAALNPVGGARADPLQVRDSIPALEGLVQGRHVQYIVRFNGLIDHSSSRIEITQSGRVVQSFPAFFDSAPDVLFASGEAPVPGRYILRWQARSSVDGTISSGEIPFSVKADVNGR
jgi:methionine-rich copper-binding protein CopC